MEETEEKLDGNCHGVCEVVVGTTVMKQVFRLLCPSLLSAEWVL